MPTIEMTDRIAAKNLRALVVDDQMLSRELLCAELAEFGVRTEQAVNGRDALAKVLAADRTEPFDIVFTDLRMPELSGLDLIERIHHAGLGAMPMTVLVTAHGLPAQVLQDSAVPSHPDRILAKPATTRDVLEVLLAACADA